MNKQIKSFLLIIVTVFSSQVIGSMVISKIINQSWDFIGLVTSLEFIFFWCAFLTLSAVIKSMKHLFSKKKQDDLRRL
ncbi:MAG: hypothetical protein E6X21_01230 [Clostridium sp.]|uniref:hypothetical protein n=1 Tax=Clostridium sp. TaxID=1506 RepID=UPI00290FF905|nr:hypothetical protein [Clostridium sp.]